MSSNINVSGFQPQGYGSPDVLIALGLNQRGDQVNFFD